MQSALSSLGLAVEALAQHLLSLQPQFHPEQGASDARFHFDREVILRKIDMFVIRLLESHIATWAIADRLKSVQERLVDRKTIVRLYETCVADQSTIDAIRKIRTKLGGESCDISEGRLLWELLFEMTRPVHGGDRRVGI